MTCSSTRARVLRPIPRKATGVLVSALLALVLVGSGLAGAAIAGAASGKLSARLSKTSFTSSQAGSVKLTYKFSKPSSHFSYLLTFKKSSKWLTVKSVKKTGVFKGSKSISVKSVFAGKSVKLGSYRLKLSCDYGGVKLSFKVVPPAKPAVTPSGSKPANTAPPTISGTATQGQTLTGSNGSWSGSPTSYSRQWRRCDSSGTNCADITGATAGTYVLASADVGRTLKIVVTASNSHGSSSASSSPTPVVSGPPAPPPTNTALPSLSGTAKQGQTLTAQDGSWSGSPTSYSRQWRRCDSSGTGCLDISGATSSSYVLASADVGCTLRIAVTASNSSGSASAGSSQTAVVASALPVNTALPTISGAAKQGHRLTALNGSWSESPTFGHQWQRCDSAGDGCSSIAGATASSYALVSDDVGHTIRLVVRATNPYGWNEATSASTAVVEVSTTFNAEGWVWQNPLPQGNQLAAVDFVNTSKGWAVGSDGTILASTDSGDNWTSQESPTTAALHAVSFISATRGWVAGADGTILSTNDGGGSWLEADTPTVQSLNAIDFIDANYGWAVGSGGTVLRTTDGGANWDELDCLTSPDLDLFGVSFVSQTKGWAVGSLWDSAAIEQYGVVYVTNDGGTTWTPRYPPSADTSRPYALQSVQFSDANNGRAVGDTGTILTTTDGGASWAEWNTEAVDSFLSTSPVIGSVGWAVSGEGTILKTTNGGSSWAPQSSGTTSSLNGVDSVDATHGWAVGGGGVILRTSDGMNWSSLRTSADDDPGPSLTSVAFAGTTNGWAADASGTILNTNDGGSDWMEQYGASRTARSYGGVDFSNADDGWAVGAGGAVFATSDGGENWNAQSSISSEDLAGVSSFGSAAWAVGAEGTILSNESGDWQAQSSPVSSALNAVKFTDATHGWIADADGTVLATGNGGDSWVEQSTPTAQSLNDIDFVDSSYGWAVDASGTILATTNGGTNWVVKATNPNLELDGVDFVDRDHGWAVGSKWDKADYDDHGVVLRTENGGATWESWSGDVGQLRSVQFANLNDGCAVGAFGAVLVTSNGGTSWSVTSPGTNDTFSGTSFANATRGWAVSAEGTILTTSDGGNIWQAQSSVNDNSLFGLAFADSNSGWAVGSHYDAVTGKHSGLILSTVDGGVGWSELTTATKQRLNSVEAIDNSNLAWAVGAEGTILSNKSGSWESQSSPVSSALNAVSFANATHGWIADASGTILATANAGLKWSEVDTPTSESLNGIDFVDASYGWAVGDHGVILATTDGGASWDMQYLNLDISLRGVRFVDRNRGWAVGSDGVVLVTSDGGLNWEPQYSRTTQSLFALDFFAPGGTDPGLYGWVVGERGAILGTTNGGIPPGP